MRKLLRTTLLVMVVVVAATVLNVVVPALGRITGTVSFKVFAWVKNMGEAEIPAIDSSAIFYKTSTTIDRLPCNASPCNGCWSYSIEADTLWKPRVTVKVTHNLTTLASGDYLVRFVTPSGVAAEMDFTV